MGVHESTEESKPALQILSGLSTQQFEYSLSKLEDLSRKKFEMQVSKWDLLLILSLKSIEVKKVMQLITQKQDPNQVSIHQLMLAMIITRQKGSGQCSTLEDKLYRIMQLICFAIEPNKVQQTEVEYIFHLISQWVEVTTGYKISDPTIVKKVCATLFKEVDLVSIDDIVKTIKPLPELVALFEVYQKEKQVPLSVKTALEKKVDSPAVDESPTKTQESKGNLKNASAKDMQEAQRPSSMSKNKEEEKKAEEQALRQSEARLDETLNQLHWNTEVLAVINKNQNSKLHVSQHSPQLAAKMSKKLQQLRQTSQLQIQPETSANLKDLMQKFSMIENVNLDIYGQKQLTYMMKSNFFEQTLVSSGFSIRDFVRANQVNQQETQDMIAFDNIMCRAQAGLSFKEYFKQQLSEIKYQQKMHQSRIIYQMTRSVEKSILEKKKYKYVGELNMLNTLIQNVLQADKQQALRLQAQSKEKEQKRGSDLQQHLPIHQVKQVEDKKDLYSNEIVPSHNTIFKRVYQELERLRACGCSRRDLVKFIELRDQKTMASKIVSFWQGVIKTLTHANQVKTFAELEYFKEFFIFAQRSLQIEENIYRQLLMEQMEIKNGFNDYTMQVGKLKALHLALKISNLQKDDFLLNISNRIAILSTRLEKLDINLVEVIHSQVLRKRSQKLFFMSVGQLASYKCISKGLNYERSIDYLGLSVCRYRMLKLIGLVCNQDKSKLMERKLAEDKKLDVEMYKQVFIMSKVQEIDTFFNLEAGSTDSARQDKNFEDFDQNCQQISNEELVLSQTPEIPILPDDITQVSKELPVTVIKIMKNFYQRHRVDLHLFRNFKEFVEQMPSGGFDLEGKLNFATEDLKNAGVVLFDFIDIEEKFMESTDKKRGDDILLYITSLSCSLSQTSFHKCINHLSKALTHAHRGCQQFANKLSNLPENDFIEHFKNQRTVVFDQFIQILRTINKGYYFNCFDIQNFSLPLECSLQNNYWCAYAIQMCLNHAEKEEKFQQLIQANSPVLLSRRSTYLNVNIASQLILAVFQLGPQSVRNSDSDSQEGGEDKDYKRDRLDFMEQYKMTRGEQHEQNRIKQMMFNDIYEQGKCILRQAEIEQSEVNTLLQVKDANKTLALVVSHMYDKVYKLQDECNMAELCQVYEQLKLDQLESLKKQAILGIFNGGLNFIKNMIRLQTNENTFGTNATMNAFKENMELAAKELQKVQEQAETDKANMPSPTRNLGIVTSDSNRTEKSYASISLNKTVVKKGNKRNTAKKKVQIAPLQKCEIEIVETLSKTSFLYRLIKLAGEEQDVKKFYEQLAVEQEAKHKYIERLKSVLVFLRVNLKREDTDAFIYQSVHEQELGCRLMQDVQSGILVNPVFVYSPADANKMGIPPLQLQQKDAKNDNLLSVADKKSKVQPDSPASQTRSNSQGKEEEKIDKSAPKSTELSYSQKATNYLLQFLNQICLMDDKITAKQILKNDTLFGFLQLMRIQISEQEAQINLRENIEKGLTQLVNVFVIQKTPIDFYLSKFERVCKFIQRDLIHKIEKTDEGHLKFYFFDIMSKKGSALVKQTINKVDGYFSLAQISDADKLEFSNAHGKIKRELDQNLRTFKEFLDLEENKKVAQSHESLLKHQELRLIQEISSLNLLVRIYYLKQIELQQPS